MARNAFLQVDGLPPAIARPQLYLAAPGLAGWIPEIDLIIDPHHEMRPYRGGTSPLAEIFRRTDLADFSRGPVTGGVPGAAVRAAKAADPDAGFHKRPAQFAGGRFARHLLSPPPFMKC